MLKQGYNYIVYCRDVYCMLWPRVVIDPISVITELLSFIEVSKKLCAMYIENKRLYYNILSVVEIYCVDYFKTHIADQQQKNYHKYVFIPVHACAYCIMVTAWSKHDLECGQQLKAVGGVISWLYCLRTRWIRTLFS